MSDSSNNENEEIANFLLGFLILAAVLVAIVILLPHLILLLSLFIPLVLLYMLYRFMKKKAEKDDSLHIIIPLLIATSYTAIWVYYFFIAGHYSTTANHAQEWIGELLLLLLKFALNFFLTILSWSWDIMKAIFSAIWELIITLIS